jgi:predicted pyridoxine 5'-phosphate oxidase superfamily flavin-nucleotide-binding protein
MKQKLLEEIVEHASSVGAVYFATADAKGVPHIAAAGKLEVAGESLAVTEWFCPGTMQNLAENKAVSIVVWDDACDAGYQVIGELEKIIDMNIMDGFSAELESGKPLPQVERKLIVRVKEIIDFKLGPHSDTEDVVCVRGEKDER